MKTIASLLTACLLLSFAAQAQRDETLFGTSGLRLTGAWGASTVGWTKFENEYAAIRGGYGGLEFNKALFLGWGGFDTNDDVVQGPNNSRFDLSYNGFMVGYSPRAHSTFHPSFNLLTGSGRVDIAGEGRDKIFVVQPSMGVEINVFRWFRFGADAGYRIVTNTDNPALNDSDLSAFYGELKFKFGWSWGR